MAPPHIPQNISKEKFPPMRRWDFIAGFINGNKWTIGAELGLWTGKTTKHLLKHCPEFRLIGVDRWAPLGDGGPYDKFDHETYEREFWARVDPYKDRLTVIKDWTVKAAESVADGSLDFVFIDADHSEKGVREDITAWLPKVKPTGLICGHDINWKSVKAAVDDLLPGYLIGPDVVWFRPVNPGKGWEKAWQ